MSLSGIVTALAAVSVTANGKTPKVYEPNAATNKLRPRFESADLPLRVVMPFGDATQVQARALTIGGTPKVMTFAPVDLLLWETAGQSRGVVDMFPALMAYIDAYNTAMRANIKLVSSPVAIVENWTFTPDIFTYGGLECWGVEVRLTVKESG